MEIVLFCVLFDLNWAYESKFGVCKRFVTEFVIYLSVQANKITCFFNI